MNSTFIGFPSYGKDRIDGTYYAFIEEIEEFNEELWVRFDSILEDNIDSFLNPSLQGMPNIPSIIFEGILAKSDLDELLNYSDVDDLEGEWVILKLKIDPRGRLKCYVNGSEYDKNLFSLTELNSSKTVNQEKFDYFQKLQQQCVTSSFPTQDISCFIDLLEVHAKNIDHVKILNVGQGNCISFNNTLDCHLVFFDIGGGCYNNSSTYPKPRNFCRQEDSIVILSHFDFDHYVTALFDIKFQKLLWLVPTQHLGPTGYAFFSIIATNCKLIVVNKQNCPKIQSSFGEIIYCNGTGKSSNNSGLALVYECNTGEKILFPGDASYNMIPLVTQPLIEFVVASHHGSEKSLVGIPISIKNGKVIYSYGKNNIFQHPSRKARIEYISNEWLHSFETTFGDVVISQYIINVEEKNQCRPHMVWD